MKLMVLIYLILTNLNTVPNQNIQLSFDDKEIDKAIVAEMSRFDIPSIVTCIIKKDTIVWEKTYGYANIEKKTPASLNTIYPIASVSKLVTSVAVLQLYERKVLDIDKDINNYLPFPVRNPKYPDKKITPLLLLTHRSGLAWPDAWPSNEAPNFYSIYPNDSAPNLGEWLKNYITPRGKNYNPKIWKNTEPGEAKLYSNIGAALLGYLVEVMSSIDFNTYCENNIFKLLDMPNTSFRISNLKKELTAMPYSENLNPIGHYSVPYYPSTTIKSSISEFSHFIIAMMNGGVYKNERILKEKTVNEILRVQYPNSWLGLMWWKYKGDWFGGQGGFQGSSSLTIFQKTAKIAILIFSNRTELDSFYPPDGRIYKLIYKKAMQF
jgi:CubicO group peptidase (beta-lactamase class C family)